MKKVSRMVEFHHEGKVYYKGAKSGAWALDPKGQKRLTAEEAAPIEAALQEKLRANEERNQNVKEAIKNAQMSTDKWFEKVYG